MSAQYQEGAVTAYQPFGAAALEQKFRSDHVEGDDPKKKLYRMMHQVPVVAPPLIPVTGAAGVAGGDQMGPNTGFHWSVRRLTAVGYSAGTITVYRNAVQTGFGAAAAAVGEVLFVFPQAGTYTFGRGEVLLEPDDYLVMIATGLTLTAGQQSVNVVGSADQFESWLLPEYLM